MSRARVLRNALILIAVGAVLIVGIRLWTAAPDTVRAIITHHTGNGSAPDVVTTIFDRTAHDPVLAQQLQRDLAALPILSPTDRFACPDMLPSYDTYSLEWSRAGLYVEQATADTTGCAFWREDGLLVRLPQSDIIYTDLHAALDTPLPPGM